MVPRTNEKIYHEPNNRGRFEGFQADLPPSLPFVRDAAILINAKLDEIYHCCSQRLSNQSSASALCKFVHYPFNKEL